MKGGRTLIKEIAASLGAAAATGTLTSSNATELLADRGGCLADCMDGLSELLEAYVSKEDQNEE
jgi:hypothetical protein